MGAAMVRAQAACDRMEKNLFAMKKQAQQANAATMKMLDDADPGQKYSTAGAGDEGNVEQLKKENVTLTEKLGSATTELGAIRAQAKGFEREHDRLLSQIQELEDQLGKTPIEDKKQK